jgi:hypothetical protein
VAGVGILRSHVSGGYRKDGRDVTLPSVRIVQFTRFSLPDTLEPSMLAVRAAAVESCRAAYPQLRDVLLVRLEGGEWLDVAVWEGDPGGGEPDGPAVFPPLAARDDFFERIDQLLGEECGQLVAHSAKSSG